MPADDTQWKRDVEEQSHDHDSALSKYRDGAVVFEDVEATDA